jgi:hypothetical protein
VVRHLASGVLGKNAPAPFQKNSLKQTIYWNGKDDLDRYEKEPEKLRVRVTLGLKPVFDKRIGGTSGKNIPGNIRGIAIGPDGAYVINQGGQFSHAIIRKYDHNGNYVCSLTPPPKGLPESKLAGLGYVEYEPGKRAVHGPGIFRSMAYNVWMNGLSCMVEEIQPTLAGTRLVFTTQGKYRTTKSLLHYICTDGSTDVPGIRGLTLVKDSTHRAPRLAASPDGKRVYISGVPSIAGEHHGSMPCTSIFTHELKPGGKAEVFVGTYRKPGSDNKRLGHAEGIDCDARGRVYVADRTNNRIQIFSPEGTYLKTIGVERPNLICVHKKTGAIYVQHKTREKGKSLNRVTKFTSFENPKKEFHWNAFSFSVMALDSWAARPRLWFSEDPRYRGGLYDRMVAKGKIAEGKGERRGLTIWEEREDTFEKIVDFHEEAKKEAGKGWFNRWRGIGCVIKSSVVCDPIRGKLYYGWGNRVFDLKTGAYEHAFGVKGHYEDIVFDKRGYMHGHQRPGNGVGVEACVWRVDPGQADPRTFPRDDLQRPVMVYPECPYDYGVERPTAAKKASRWTGAIPARGQSGAQGFQHGLGVNMGGDVVVGSKIKYAPKMGDEIREYSLQGSNSLPWYNEEAKSYDAFVTSIKESLKRGAQVYFIKRRPGILLYGATVWTFDRSGELRKECAVLAGNWMDGTLIDEDRSLYFNTARIRMKGGKKFLAGKGGTIGAPEDRHNRNPFTGTMVKTMPDTFCLLRCDKAPVKMDQVPNRPPDLARSNKGKFWVEGAEWMFAGAAPVVEGGCICPRMRAHLDWYKRTYVPEAYRHSIGILDTNGNLILHVGRYANFDSAPGGKNGCKPGGSDIGITSARYIGGTDDYLAFEDWGERIVVLRLDYHAEETAPIGQ